MCNLICVHGCSLLSMSECVRSPKSNFHLLMITEWYRMSHTHPEGCTSVHHHTTVAFEVPAMMLLSPALEADPEIMLMLLLM